MFAYVDDVRMFLRALIIGIAYCNKCRTLWVDNETPPEDETDAQRTARVLCQIFNSVEKDLKFTVETCEDFNSLTLPTLDTQLWVEDKIIPIPATTNTQETEIGENPQGTSSSSGQGDNQRTKISP